MISHRQILTLFITCILLLGAFGTAQKAAGQTFDNSIESRDIRMVLDPPTPGTNETVTISVTSLVVNVNRLLITWFVDGQVVDSGIGKTSITITTKRQGQLSRVEAYVQIDNVSNLRKWIQIAPADLDILWEADTYTPPFYRGKALPTPESHIKIVGMPNLRNRGVQSLENEVVFNWKVNNKNQSTKSGFGKNPLTIRNDFLRLEERISLNVQHTDGLTQAEENIVIKITQPKVVLYRGDSPLRNANNLDFEDTELQSVEIVAEPFHFSSRPELLNLLSYRWRINGQILNELNPRNKNVLSILPDPSQGAANVSLLVENPVKLLQSASSGDLAVIQ